MGIRYVNKYQCIVSHSTSAY